MQRKFKYGITLFSLIMALTLTASAASIPYKCQNGDSMQKIADRYQINIKELIKCNPHLQNPEKLKAGDQVNIPSDANVQTLEAEVARLVNVERQKHGLQTLTLNSQLSYSARLKSQDMIDKNYFSHTSPTYGSPFDMMETFGLKFSAGAENIAYGQKTAADVMQSWMNSPGHRSNILSPTYNQIGVGCAKKANGTMYWTQQFIKTP